MHNSVLFCNRRKKSVVRRPFQLRNRYLMPHLMFCAWYESDYFPFNIWEEETSSSFSKRDLFILFQDLFALPLIPISFCCLYFKLYLLLPGWWFGLLNEIYSKLVVQFLIVFRRYYLKCPIYPLVGFCLVGVVKDQLCHLGISYYSHVINQNQSYFI